MYNYYPLTRQIFEKHLHNVLAIHYPLLLSMLSSIIVLALWLLTPLNLFVTKNLRHNLIVAWLTLTWPNTMVHP